MRPDNTPIPAAPIPTAPIPTVPTSTVPAGLRTAREWTWSLGLIGLGVYGAAQVFSTFSTILVAVLVALLVTALLHPVTRRIPARVPRGLATLSVLLGVLLVLLALFALVGQQVVSQFDELRDQTIAGLKEVLNWLATGPLQLSSSQLSDYLTQFEQWLSENGSSILSSALGLTTSATHVIEGFFIAVFSTFFFLSSGRSIWAWLLRILPREARRPTDDAARSGWVTLSHYVRATFLVAIVDGLGVGIGTAVLGVPLSLALGVVVFFGAFVPVVGALLTGAVAVLVALVAKGWVVASAVLAVVVLVNQLEAHVLQPFLLGRAVDVHPLAVILSLSAGYAVAGILGALFAVPAAAVANTVVTSLANRGERDPGERIAQDGAPLAPDKPEPTDAAAPPAGE